MPSDPRTWTLSNLRHAFWGGDRGEHGLLSTWIGQGRNAADLFRSAGAAAFEGTWPPVGYWVSSRHSERISLVTTGAYVNRPLYQPLWLPSPLRIDRAGVEVVIGADGSVIRIGLYAPEVASGLPGERLVSFGPVSVATVGNSILTPSPFVIPAGLTWVASCVQGGQPNLRCFNIAPYTFPTPFFNAGAVQGGLRHATTDVSAELPEQAVVDTTALGIRLPIVQFRRAPDA
jgi:hypothetical protein